MMGISPKVNVIARLEFEQAYFEAEGQLFNPYAIRTPSSLYFLLSLSLSHSLQLGDLTPYDNVNMFIIKF